MQSYRDIFDIKKSINPNVYVERVNDKVGEYHPLIDEQISMCEEYISDNPLNPVTQDEIKEKWCEGIPLISIKYTPNVTRYELIEDILTKLEKCNNNWGTNFNLTEERINNIYDMMVSFLPIEQVLNLFTLDELECYGW